MFFGNKKEDVFAYTIKFSDAEYCVELHWL